MRKIFTIFFVLMLTFFTIPANANDSPSEDIRISYGVSKIYSNDDMDAAVKIILKQFEQWQGCELHSVVYMGDECNNEENLRWMNELAKAQKIQEKMVQCAGFLSDFYVSREAEKHTTFNPETEYKNWQWWLARSEKGEWKLLTFGY